jgi:hypothetical protein
MIQVKTHNKKNNTDFFIQSKGNNAGQPLNESTANCFDVIIADKNRVLPQYAFYMVLNAYNQDAFKKYIKGSVIPFITIDDFITAFNEFYNQSK